MGSDALTPVTALRDDYNWQNAMDVAVRDTPTPQPVQGYAGPVDFRGWDDVAGVVASSPGDNDGPDWIALLRLNDGRHVLLSAGCDNSGWG